MATPIVKVTGEPLATVSRTNVVIGALTFAFLIFIAARGSLTVYRKVLF